MTVLVVVCAIVVLCFLSVLVWLRHVRRRPIVELDYRLSAIDRSITASHRAMAEAEPADPESESPRPTTFRIPEQRSKDQRQGTPRVANADRLPEIRQAS